MTLKFIAFQKRCSVILVSQTANSNDWPTKESDFDVLSCQNADTRKPYNSSRVLKWMAKEITVLGHSPSSCADVDKLLPTYCRVSIHIELLDHRN
jgi:hypothetical protein